MARTWEEVDPKHVPAGEPGVRDWGYHAQVVAQEHLDLVEAWQEFYENDGYDDEGKTPEPDQPDPAIGPYDGCGTCMIREILYASWPVIEAATLSGDLE